MESSSPSVTSEMRAPGVKRSLLTILMANGGRVRGLVGDGVASFLFFISPDSIHIERYEWLIIHSLRPEHGDRLVPINVTRHKTKKYPATVCGTVLLPVLATDALK